MQKAKPLIPAIRVIKLSAQPIRINDKEKNMKENNSGRRLSNLETNQPEIGSPIRELTGITSKRFPS